MTTSADVLNGARSWLGTAEQPGGSNNVPGITDWYGVRGAWCAMFVSRVFHDAGMPLPASTPKGFAWVSAGFDWFRRQGWEMFTDWHQARPGDLIAWEWGSTPGGFDHISIVESNDAGGFITIGGNERDRVKREFFGAPGGAALFARPPYSVPAPPTIEVRPTVKEPVMYRLTNHDGREEFVKLFDDGTIRSCWQDKPGGKFGPWAQIIDGVFTDLHAVDDLVINGEPRRLALTATAAAAYGYALVGSWQATPGAPWVKPFVVNDLIGLGS